MTQYVSSMPAKETELSLERLKRRSCPHCLRMVILEPLAKEGDVLLCPGCQERLVIARSGAGLELRRWKKEVSVPLR